MLSIIWNWKYQSVDQFIIWNDYKFKQHKFTSTCEEIHIIEKDFCNLQAFHKVVGNSISK